MTFGWRQWLRLARTQAGPLALLLGLMLAGIALGALKPWPLKLLVDYALTERPLPQAYAWIGALPGGGSPEALVVWLAAGSVAVFAAAWAVYTIQVWLQTGIGSRLTYAVAEMLFDHLQRLSPRHHGQHATGDLVRRITHDSSCVRQFVLGVCVPALTSVVTLVTMFSVMWALDPQLAAVALGVAPLLALVVRFWFRPMSDRTYEQQQREGEMMAYAERALTAIPAVQAFGREAREDAGFRDLSRLTLRAYLRAVVAQLQFRTRIEATTAVGTAVLMILGGIHVMQGTLTVGSLLVFLAYLSALYAPLTELANLSSGIASAAAGLRRVREHLESDDRIADSPEARALPACRGHLRFENVTFGYEPETPVLQDVTFGASPGQRIALVGRTGAGKSTLVSLVPRLFDPWSGRVTLDGFDLRDLRLASLRSQVALVLQEPFLLPLSVAENIAYGWPDAPRAQVEAAARAANADEFIRRLPQGYDTVIGERGATLSGGQKQRLAIARALLKDAPVVILDEPTSALDSRSEKLVFEALERLTAGRTTLIIAHRLSTIRRADRIVVLERGRIVETGTHAELLKTAGWYRRFHEAQAGRVLTNPAAGSDEIGIPSGLTAQVLDEG